VLLKAIVMKNFTVRVLMKYHSPLGW